MPGSTEYTYKIKLDARSALASAVSFKRDLEKQLSNIKIGAKVNTAQFQAAIQQAATASTKTMGTALDKAMAASVQKFRRQATHMAPQTMLAPMEQALKQGIAKPSLAAVKSLNDLRVAMVAAHDATQQMGVGVDQWMDASKVDRWGIALQAAQRRVWGIRGFGYQMQAHGRGMVAAGGAAIGGMAAAAKSYIDYSEPLGRAARNLELNAENAAWLDKELRNMAGAASLFSPKEQAEQLYLWAAATGEVAETQEDLARVIQNTQEVQKLAHLGMVDQEQAVETTTDIMSQYQLSVEDTEKIVATLVKVAAVSKAEVGDLGMAFRYAGARAEASNTSFEETAATLQILSGFGMRGTMAGRGLARLMENLIAPSKAARKEMDALFESAFGATAAQKLRTAEGEFIGIGEAIDVLAEATATLPDAMARQEFVSRITTQNASRVLIPLLEMQIQAREKNIDAIVATTNILEGTVGSHERAYMQMVEDIYGYEVSAKSAAETAEDQWQEFLNSTAGRVQSAKSEFSGAFATIGESVVQYALPAVEDLADWVSDLAETIEANDWTIELVLKGARDVIILGGLLMAGGKIISIYADIKAIMMANTMRVAANKQVLAASEMLLAAQMMMGGGVTQVAGAGVATTAGGVLLPASASAAGATAGASLATLVSTVATVAIAAGVIALIVNEVLKIQKSQVEDTADTFKYWTARQAEAIIFGPEGKGRWADPYHLESGTPSPFKYDVGKQQIQWQKSGREATIEEVDKYLESLSLTEKSVWEKRADLNKKYAEGYAAQVEAYEAAQAREMKERATTSDRAEMGLTGIPGVQVDYFERAALGMDQLNQELAEGATLAADFTAIIARWQSYIDPAVDSIARLGAIAKGIQAVMGVPSPADLESQVRSAATSGWQDIRGLGGLMSPEQIAKWGALYTKGLKKVYLENRYKEQWQIDLAVDAFKRGWAERVQTVKDSQSEMEKAHEEYQANVERAQKSFRGFVGGLLAPTQVTAEDVWETEQGIYEDKWDEYPRRLRAGLAGSPDFEKMIPEGMDDAGRARWVQNEIEAFYAGMRPEMINWDAVAKSFTEKMALEQGKERMVDLAMAELKERGISLEREDIAAFFGLTSPAEQAFFGGQAPSAVGDSMNQAMKTALGKVEFDQEDADATADSFAGKFTGGLQVSFENTDWMLMLSSAWMADFDENKSKLEDLGKAMADPIVDGLRLQLESYDFIMLIISIVMTKIREALG